MGNREISPAREFLSFALDQDADLSRDLPRLNRFEILLGRIQVDPDYERCLDCGKPRRGPPEGTVRAHIEELVRNLDILSSLWRRASATRS